MTRTILGLALAASMLAGAAQAQQLTVYTANPASLIDNLAKGFEKQTGTKVNVFQATTGQLMARLQAESANPQADVLISAAWDTAIDMKAKDQLLAYESPNAKNVPAALKDQYYVAQGAAALAIIWNPKSGKTKPADWADLAKPEYKDMLTMPDPSSSGAAYGLVSGLTALPNFGWGYFETLKANGTIVPGANAQALNPVMQGAKAAVIGGVDYISLEAKTKGEQIEVIYPSSGTVLEARPAMILKTTKNPEAAKRFIDYMLSDEGQKIVADVYLLPARTDIAAKRAGWNDIKLLAVEESTASKRAETLAKFKATMGLK
ncbi:MAG: ABC transporter substrate-binding protein [Alphaproteobacteria bacterium]